MKNLLFLKSALAVTACMIVFASCSKSELPEAPGPQTEAAEAKVGGWIGLACPSNSGLWGTVRYDGAMHGQDHESWDHNIPMGTSGYVPDITAEPIYFSFNAPKAMTFSVQGPIEIIEQNGYSGYYRYKYKYDANGRITDMNGMYPDGFIFNALITAH